ncbi:MAG: HlyD family efflux transporter periplasmic adaptor subunit, partial [Cyclobacteriaceae bacterium]
EATGKILELSIEEGQILKKGEVIGYIDTLQLHLKKKQLQYSVKAVLTRQPDASSQLATIQEQIATTKREKVRFEKLLKDDAATQKQVDDLNAHLNLLQKQYDALQSSLSTTTQSVRSEAVPLTVQVEQLEDQIKKSIITNPLDGTVLVKYAEENEVTAPGKALYKIADLSSVILRAYITGNQFSEVKLNQKVKVFVDDLEENYKTYEGDVIWIADKAEFTPKTIQTKEERANLVYAIKIKVKNDGFLKIGMYGEVELK